MVNYFNVKMENEFNAYELYSNSAMNDLYNQLVEKTYFLSSMTDTASFGDRPFDGGITGTSITVSTAGYYPKTLYNSVRYFIDGEEKGEYWDMPYTATFDNLSEGWHSLKTQLVDGRTIEMDIPAQTINDRTMIPLRAVSEAMNAKVDWSEESSTVSITYRN